MTKEKILKDFKIDVNYVDFKTSSNGLFEYSERLDDADAHYIIKQGDDYKVVCGNTNSVATWKADLSRLGGK